MERCNVKREECRISAVQKTFQRRGLFPYYFGNSCLSGNMLMSLRGVTDGKAPVGMHADCLIDGLVGVFWHEH